MRIGINGFGRIGKNFLKALMERHGALEVVAVNDLSPAGDCAHLFAYDSNYGRYAGKVSHSHDSISIDGRTIKIFAERDPAKLPWKAHGVELVVEATGLFTDASRARAHIDGGGAKKVVISAPANGEDITLVMGVNDGDYEASRHHIISNASCTTNCLAAVIKPLVAKLGWVHGFMNTVHAYTNDQNILDAPHKDLRRARNAASNIIPTSTGAATALSRTIPEVRGTFDGIALRVPVSTVSICYLVARMGRETEAAEVNTILATAAKTGPLHGILQHTEEPLVSSDFRRSPYSAIADGKLTKAFGDLIQVGAWYDNEWGYSCRLADLVHKVAASPKSR